MLRLFYQFMAQLGNGTRIMTVAVTPRAAGTDSSQTVPNGACESIPNYPNVCMQVSASCRASRRSDFQVPPLLCCARDHAPGFFGHFVPSSIATRYIVFDCGSSACVSHQAGCLFCAVASGVA